MSFRAESSWVCLALLAGCGSCEETSPRAAPAAVATPAPQSWTLGAVGSHELVLPSPCNEREPTLRTVLTRDIRFAASRSRVGELWVAEGTADREGVWHADASGIVTMAHGPTAAIEAPWPARGEPIAATDASGWRLAYDFDAGAGPQLAMWHQGEREVLGAGLTAVDMTCRDERCALLVSSTGKPEAWLGTVAEPAALWQRVSLGPGRPLGLQLLRDSAIAMVTVAEEVRFLAIAAGAPAATAATVRVSAPPIAALADPLPIVMTVAPHQMIDGCASDGGVRIELAGSSGPHLRSAEPPRRGVLLRLERGYLAAWLAPHRCASRRHLLYAVPLREDGSPMAPVTAVGMADEFAAASTGSDIDVWLHDATERTITWVRARCTP